MLAGIDLLRGEGWKIPETAVREGLRGARLACRFETVSEDPLFVVDGAHNPQCTGSLAENLCAYYPDRKFTFIVGVLADKDYPAMLQMVLPFAKRFVTLTPQNPRALTAEVLADAIVEMGQEASAASSYREALRFAFSDGGPVCAFGSLYMVGLLRAAYIACRGIRS